MPVRLAYTCSGSLAAKPGWRLPPGGRRRAAQLPRAAEAARQDLARAQEQQQELQRQAEALDAQRQGLARLVDDTQGRLEQRRRELLEMRVPAPAEAPAGQSAPAPRNEGGGAPD
jgi:hypothetical protein